MKKRLSMILAGIAMVATKSASLGCTWVIFDEPQSLNSFQD